MSTHISPNGYRGHKGFPVIIKNLQVSSFGKCHPPLFRPTFEAISPLIARFHNDYSVGSSCHDLGSFTKWGVMFLCYYKIQNQDLSKCNELC